MLHLILIVCLVPFAFGVMFWTVKLVDYVATLIGRLLNYIGEILIWRPLGFVLRWTVKRPLALLVQHIVPKQDRGRANRLADPR